MSANLVTFLASFKCLCRCICVSRLSAALYCTWLIVFLLAIYLVVSLFKSYVELLVFFHVYFRRSSMNWFCRNTWMACGRPIFFLALRTWLLTSREPTVVGNLRRVSDDHTFGKENQLCREDSYVQVKGSSGEDDCGPVGARQLIFVHHFFVGLDQRLPGGWRGYRKLS